MLQAHTDIQSKCHAGVLRCHETPDVTRTRILDNFGKDVNKLKTQKLCIIFSKVKFVCLVFNRIIIYIALIDLSWLSKPWCISRDIDDTSSLNRMHPHQIHTIAPPEIKQHTLLSLPSCANFVKHERFMTLKNEETQSTSTQENRDCHVLDHGELERKIRSRDVRICVSHPLMVCVTCVPGWPEPSAQTNCTNSLSGSWWWW